MRHQPLFVCNKPFQIVIDLDAVDRRNPQALQFGYLCQQSADHLSETGWPGRSPP